MDLEIAGRGIDSISPTETDYVVATLIDADVDAILKQIPAEQLAKALALVDKGTQALQAVADDLENRAAESRRMLEANHRHMVELQASIELLTAQKAHAKAQRDAAKVTL